MKKIYCELDNDDYAQISIDDGLVEISLAQGNDMNVVVFSPDKIRKLRKQLKKALEAIEGVDEEDTEEPKDDPKPKDPNFPDWFQKGEIVEITGNSNLHQFKIGEKVRVVGGMQCEGLDGSNWWYVRPGDCKPA